MQQQTPHPERITSKTIWHGLLDIFNLERGLIYTVVALTTKPGAALREYLYENRKKLVPPFRFLIFTVAIGTFLTLQYFKYNELAQLFETGFKQGAEQEDLSDRGQEFLQAYMKGITYIYNNYFNVFLLAGVPIMALMTFWLWRKKMNYAEHLVINSYLTSYLTLIYIVMMPILWLSDYMKLSILYFIGSLIYSAYFYIQVFQEKIGRGIFKTFIVNLLYLLAYYILVIIIFIVAAIILMPKN
ncbi:MAG: DUF3667 domain-containing protein [Saprospiraceae bacterium]|nr:DUF3667 domain-containing protein [Saprospiraceae bacterium]